jgi:hypothetical protein
MILKKLSYSFMALICLGLLFAFAHCAQRAPSQDPYPILAKAFTGFNRSGVAVTCYVKDPSIACPPDASHAADEQYRVACQNEGYSVQACACYVYLCSGYLNANTDTDTSMSINNNEPSTAPQ